MPSLEMAWPDNCDWEYGLLEPLSPQCGDHLDQTENLGYEHPLLKPIPQPPCISFDIEAQLSLDLVESPSVQAHTPALSALSPAATESEMMEMMISDLNHVINPTVVHAMGPFNNCMSNPGHARMIPVSHVAKPMFNANMAHTNINPINSINAMTAKTATSSSRKRNRLPANQKAAMVALFDSNDTPPTNELRALANRFRMSLRRVQYWFQNRRAVKKRRAISTLRNPVLH